MSEPKYFLYDICGLKVGDMECMDIVKSEESQEAPDENQKVEKLKESHLLLKKKLSLSHELIKQFNDKIKECQQISTELEAAKDNVKKITQKHISSLSKITQLELENEEHRHKIENFVKIVAEQQTKISADQQHLQQLICKVQQLKRKEPEKSKEEALKEKIKLLENDLKAAKESHKSEIKEMKVKLKTGKVTDVAKNQTRKNEDKISHEKSTCTSDELEPVIIKPEMVERCTMTNEFYSIKNDPYPLFCSKCQIKLDPVPLDQIFKQMSSCPTLITEVLSPPKQSVFGKLPVTPRASNKVVSSQLEVASDDLNRFNQSFDSVERNSDVSRSDFQRLEQKLCLLERKLRKKLKSEVQGRNPCCGFQHPNSCYLGPYPNLFQPRAMVRNQADLFQFQNCYEGLRNRKRRSQLSVRRSNWHGSKLRKKRRLEDGTSEWNVDSVPRRDFDDSNHTNASDNDSDHWNESLRPETPPLNCGKRKNKAPKRRKENESCRPLRQRKEDKISTLFSPARSSSPRLDELDTKAHTDDAVYSQPRTESPEVRENGSITPVRSPEYETVECVSKKRGRGVTKTAKPSTKRSLVAKIRNLKKNCNKNVPTTNKIGPVNNTEKLISNQILGATVLMDALGNNVSIIQPMKNNQSLNSDNDYCPVKKHRVAHSAHKPKNDLLCTVNKNSTQLPKISLQCESVNNNVTNDAVSKTVPVVKELDDLMDKNEIIECMKNPEPVVQIEHRSSIQDFADTNCPLLVEKPALKYFEAELVAETATSGIEIRDIRNDMSEANNSSVNEGLSGQDVTPLQPCVLIPKMYLGIEGVEDPCAATRSAQSSETEEGKSEINMSLNTEKILSKEASLRILRSKMKTNKSDSKDLFKNELTSANEDIIDSNSTLSHSQALLQTMRVELTRCEDNIHPPKSPDDKTSEPMSDIHDCSVSVNSDTAKEANEKILENNKTGLVVATRKYKRKPKIAEAPISPIRELRSRRIILNPSTNLEETKCIKEDPDETSDKDLSDTVQLSENINTPSNEGLGPKALISQHLLKQKQNSCTRKRVNEKLQQRKENLVLKELSKLAEDEEWTKAVLLEAIERLSKFKTHTVAKCTVDFLATKAEDHEQLDRTHTPPAPLLTKTQQRVLTMLVALNRTMPNLMQLVQAGIEFKLFRLGHAPEVEVLEELTRVFTALARVQKDRERMRILCCDALYCLGLKAMPVIYVILVSWPEVLPMAGSSSDPLLLCLTDAIMTQTGDTSFPKFFSLKKLLTGYYTYESSGDVSNALTKNFMTTLREKRVNGLDTAIILLAKKKGPAWTDKNIVKGGLLQMIVQKAHPSIHDAFCLLGHLMRSFPVDDKKGLVKDILEQLCTLMDSREGTAEQQTGIATALFSLIRHKQDVVAKTLLNWEPRAPLSELMSRQFSALFNSHPPCWWNKLIHKNSIHLN